ncbi:hypothetical protein [Caballeronia sp. TF1N1]|uniref:hypothetical protein n=1 Tax=Caballeronia sp. TF1N1 TaxID=2878153 RepID=UPI001FD2B65F|nr:hypothetical protein [Caballeronia sp. TF1N1]
MNKPFVVITYAMLRTAQDLSGDPEQEGFLLQAKMVVDEHGKFCYEPTTFFNTKTLVSIDLKSGRCETADYIYQIISHAEIQVYQMTSIERSKAAHSKSLAIRMDPEAGDNNTQLTRW